MPRSGMEFVAPTGVSRARIENVISENPHYTAQVQVLEDSEPDEATAEAPGEERGVLVLR